MDRTQTAKFAFFYMLSLVALIIMTIATVTVGFQLINKHVPDTLNMYDTGMYDGEALKVAISAIIIAAPIYYLMMWLIQKNLRAGKLDKEAGVRKWLTYFIMLVAAIVMIVWLIMTINSFLNGELTAKFILKALAAIFASAVIFIFYFHEIRRSDVTGPASQVIRAFCYGSIALAAIALIAAILNVESPLQARNRKLDMAILQKFDTLNYAIEQYYNENKKMPTTLDQLKQDYPNITDDTLTDTAAGKKFDYQVVEDKRYELCATFQSDNTQNKNVSYYDMKDRWPHASGYQCLKQKVTGYDMGKVVPVPAMP